MHEAFWNGLFDTRWEGAPRGPDDRSGHRDGVPRRLASWLWESGMTGPRDGTMGFSAPTPSTCGE